MYEHTQERLMDEIKIQARLHGAEFEDKESKTKPKKQKDLMKFQHPDVYKSMSKEEREELTKKMKQALQPLTQKVLVNTRR